jgi:hypothetical protein
MLLMPPDDLAALLSQSGDLSRREAEGLAQQLQRTAPQATDSPLAGLMADAKQRLATRAADVARISAESPVGVRMRRADGQMAAVGPDPTVPGKYRVTFIDQDGPSGHSEYSTYQEALDRALQDGFTPASNGSPATTQGADDLAAALQRASSQAGQDEFAFPPIAAQRARRGGRQ